MARDVQGRASAPIPGMDSAINQPTSDVLNRLVLGDDPIPVLLKLARVLAKSEYQVLGLKVLDLLAFEVDFLVRSTKRPTEVVGTFCPQHLYTLLDDGHALNGGRHGKKGRGRKYAPHFHCPRNLGHVVRFMEVERA